MAKAFKGRWRISEMDVWDNDYLDLVEPAHIVFESENDGAFVFGTVKGWLDVRYGARDGSACAEFSWEGLNDNDPACGRGWVILGTAGRLVGTSSSTTAMTPASSPNANEFFNSLLVLLRHNVSGMRITAVQHGHRSSFRTRSTIRVRRMVEIEFAT